MKYITLFLTIIHFLFMTYLFHQNGTETAQTSLKLAEFLGDENLNGWLRKVAHVVVFFILSVLLSLTVDAWNADWRWLFVGFLWAVVDEATKPLVHGRHFAWFDVGLNEIGSLIGVIFGVVIRFLV